MDDFILDMSRLRARHGKKWQRYGPDVIPAWIADMDFSVAEPVQEAIESLVARRDYGYLDRNGDASLSAVFATRMRDRFDWEVDHERVVTTTELVQSIFAAIHAFSDPGDGVVLQMPIYPPFIRAVEETGRRVVENPLLDDGTRFTLDVEGFRQAIDDRTKVMVFCNPHNPTGRVFERDELLALGQAAVERGLLIVSDEIHADLVYPGRRHIPFASLSPEIAARTITITSATKGFNIAGLRCAVMHFGSAALQEQFFRMIPRPVLGQASTVGIDATIAAWRHGQPWLDAVLARLLQNRDFIAEYLQANLPEVRYYQPEGTYLAWLDCEGLELPGTPFQFFLDQARVGLSDGGDFGREGRHCARLNFATSPEVLQALLDRMSTAVHTASRPMAAAR